MTATAALPPFIVALTRPEAYPHPANDVRLLQTHISYVLLAGDYAYKVKKAVALGFVDYSNLDRRHQFCEDEVRLNRRLCDDVYLGVVPITRKGGRYVVGGPGDVVEYAVQMRRVPDEQMLPQMLERGDVTDSLVRRIAREIAAFHERVPASTPEMPYGRITGMRSVWNENFDQVRPFIGITVDPARFETLEQYVAAFLEREGELLEARADSGRVRDGHGDMRSDSIAIGADGRICIMDCIEFSERLRYGDVASEIAFLAMDLDLRGHADLADELTGAYLGATHDETLPLMLPFYRCYRAFVRGKVESLRSAEQEVPKDERDASARRARGYFALAEGYTAARTPALVMMAGVAGSGKSHVADALAARMGAALVASDIVRRDEVPGAGDRYAVEARDHVYRAMHERAARHLARGRSVVLDATYMARGHREAAHAVAMRARARFVAVHVESSPEAVRAHFAARAEETGAASEADVRVYDMQRAEFEPLDELQPAEIVRLDGAARASENVARVLARLDGGG